MAIRLITWNKPRQPTEQELRQLLEKENLKPSVYSMQRNEDSGVIEQPYDETRIILTGKMELIADGRSHKLKAGDRVDLDKGTVILMRNQERGNTTMLCAKHGERVFVERY